MDPSDANVPLRKKLANFIHDTSFEKLPENVIHRAKLCLLDLIGVAIAGSRQNASSIVQRLIPAIDGGGGVTLWGGDRKLSLLTAVLMNAVRGHAIDMDDGHRFANGHPGVVTIPAAVALAEKENLTGRELIEALVIGYEFFIRLGAAINPDLLLRGFHTTATVGCFSSGAAASKLLKLSRSQTENALSLSGLQSAGLLEVLHSGESGKSFQVGKAAQNGVLAAFMAQQGADGPECIFEGEKAFFKAFGGKLCDIHAICKNLGETFNLPSVYFKKHAACRHIHSALDATEVIVAKHSLATGDIETIDIETYSIAKSLTGHIAAEDSELGAKFSTPVAIGLLLVFGQSDSRIYQKQYLSDPRVRSIAKKVRLHVNPDNDKLYPEQRCARVTINAAGRSLTHKVMYPRGEPENPLSDEEMWTKFEKNASVLYPREKIRKLYETILKIDNLDVRSMTMLLGAA